MNLDATKAQAARSKFVAGLVADWSARQRPRIEEARGPIIASACRYEVERIAGSRDAGRAPIILTADQIQTCEDRAVSQARIQAYGPYSLRRHDDGESWTREMETVRAMLRSGTHPEPVHTSGDKPLKASAASGARLAELAAARREGRKPQDLGSFPEDGKAPDERVEGAA